MCQSPEIEIISVDHLIPIKVDLKIGDKECMIQAFVDYTNQQIHCDSDVEKMHGKYVLSIKSEVMNFLRARQQKVIEEQQEIESRNLQYAEEYYRAAKSAQSCNFPNLQEEEDDE